MTAVPDLVLRALGTNIGLSLPHHDEDTKGPVLQELQRIWARCLTDDGEPAEIVEVPVGAAVGEEVAARAAFSRLTQLITGAAIRQRTGELLMLHAAAVAHPESGRALAFVAPGGTGKTTLAQAAARKYPYISDETVGIRPDGVIEPYPKPLSRRVPEGGKKEISPGELGLVPLEVTPRLCGLALLNRVPEHDGPVQVTELSLFDGITALTPESSALARLPRPLHLLADLIAAIGPVERWTYRDAEDLLPLIDARLNRADTETRHPEEPVPTPPAEEPRERNEPGVANGRTLQISPDVVDVLDGDDGALVLIPNQLRRLSLLGSELLAASTDSTTEQALMAHVVERFGNPPEGTAEELVKAAVDDLITSGVLQADGD